MKRFTGLFLLISLLGFLSLALASDFSPHQSGNDDSDDDNIYRIRARRSAEIYAKKLALEKGQENPSTLSESNDELNQKFPSWQKESYSSLSDDNDDSDNSDGGRHFKGIKEGDTSDDLSDAEPAVRARLKA